MKRVKYLFLVVLLLFMSFTCLPPGEVKASTDNKMSDYLFEGQSFFYRFVRIGEIKKVTFSNKKILSRVDYSGDELIFYAKSAGKTKITVVGSAYTYTINLTIKKMDVTAEFVKELPDGKYLVKVTNNTKEGYFEDITFDVALRSSNGDFLDWDEEYSIPYIAPGDSYYEVYDPDDLENIDMSKCTLEVNNFTTEAPSSGYTYTDCSSKIAIVKGKGGAIKSAGTDMALQVKNNASMVASTYAKVYWYNEKKEIVKVENVYFYDLNSKEVSKKVITTPEEKYGAVSYSVSIFAYNKSN